MKIRKTLLWIFALLLVVGVFIFSLLQGIKKPVTVSGFAMGSPVGITVYDEMQGEEKCEPALKRIQLIDNTYLSHTTSTSAVFRLNSEKELVCDKWFADYFKECVALSEECEGFTLFCGEMKNLWRIENGGYIPTDDEIAKLLDSLEKAELTVDGNSIIITKGGLDLGALGKGTACDEAIQTLKSAGVRSALVTVGGTVGVMGSPDNGEAFTIGVRNPFGGQNDYFATLQGTDCFVSTSGDYEKYFEKDEIRYSHIFDARTGKPVQNDITSVTVVAKSGILSDFLSTAIFIEGAEKGMELAKKFDAGVIIVYKDKKVVVSDGLKDKLTVIDSGFSVIE